MAVIVCGKFHLCTALLLLSPEWLSQALKYYLSVVKHFDDYFEGQYDYHGYCLRKFTLTSYHSVRTLSFLAITC